MKRFAIAPIFALILLPALSLAVEPAPAIRLPVLPVSPAPVPAPTQVTKLSAGQLYVISSDAEVLVLASRDGFVEVDALKTPITIYGLFVDPQPGDRSGRSYAAGFVYVVRAVSTGQVELLVASDLKGKNVIRRVLDVSGDAPAPPGPGPKPPDPPTPVDPLTITLQAAYDKDTDPLKSAKLSILAGIMQEAAAQAIDPAVTTTQQLGNAVHVVTEQKIGKYTDGVMKSTRDAVGAFLQANLPPLAKTPITNDDRNKLSVGYSKVATALKGVKP